MHIFFLCLRNPLVQLLECAKFIQEKPVQKSCKSVLERRERQEVQKKKTVLIYALEVFENRQHPSWKGYLVLTYFIPPCGNLLALLTPRTEMFALWQRAPPSKLHLAYLPYLEESISKLLWLCWKVQFVYSKPLLKMLLKLCVTSFFEPIPFRIFDSIFKVLHKFQILP